MPEEIKIISQTKKWIQDVVIGCNFCPFAAKVLRQDSISIQVLENADKKNVLEMLHTIFSQMDENNDPETALLVLPDTFKTFNAYLSLLETSEAFLAAEGYEGKFQMASFHPLYVFAGSTEDDASNYTNRSPYPMLHILREESVSNAVDTYPGIDNIPLNNIETARNKGLSSMQALRNACFVINPD